MRVQGLESSPHDQLLSEGFKLILETKLACAATEERVHNRSFKAVFVHEETDTQVRCW